MRRILSSAVILVLLAAFVIRTQGLNISQPSPVNVTQVGSSAVSTAASGVQKVGVVGNAGAAVDAATNAAAPANVLWHVNAPSTAAGVATSATAVAALSVQNIKASAGNVYGFSLQNSNSSICWLQFYNTAGTPTLGTSVIWAVAVPASGSLSQPTGPLALKNHSTGIGVGSATTATGSTACTTALSGTLFYE